MSFYIDDKKVDRALAWIDAACYGHGPVAVFGLFSGGDDSLTAVHIAARHPQFTAAVHVNTGIGIEKTRVFVRETCKKFGWPLQEYFAKDYGYDYRELAIKYGFPGPAQHFRMYSRLKERGLRDAIRRVKRKRSDRVMLVTGVRTGESERRMGTVGVFERRGIQLWTNPIYDWAKADCLEYLQRFNVERNPVAALIHKSGECLCGAFAKNPSERKELAYWFPEVDAELRSIEEAVAATGNPACRWGYRPPGKRKKRVLDNFMPLCHGCEKDRPS